MTEFNLLFDVGLRYLWSTTDSLASTRFLFPFAFALHDFGPKWIGAALQWADWPEVERSPVPEPESPWTAVERADAQDNVFDPVRFWHSVGFLYDIGEPGEALADPFMATGIMPAGSSAYRDMTPYRLHTPAWIPQNCTACGLCWAHCPDSALPPTLQSVQSVLETGMTLCKQDGLPLTQFTRIAGHISKLAHKLVTADGLHQFQSAGPLLAEAFAQLAPVFAVNLIPKF